MAVTITVAELLAALRLGDTDEEVAQGTRLLAYATTAVTKHAPNCPDEIHNESVVRLCGYLFDQPFVGRGPAYANALRNSGSAAILLPYKIIRAGNVEGAIAAAQEAVGSPGNPVTNVTINGSVLTITFADGSTRPESLPAGGDGDGIDQVARDAAAAAQTTADGRLAADAVNPFALTVPHVPIAPQDLADEGTAPSTDGLIPQTVTNGRSFRFINPETLIPSVSQATESARGTVRGATSAQATAASGTTILGWANNRLRQLVHAIVPTWARANNDTPIPADKLTLAPSGPAGDPAWPWAERGNTEVIPTGKIPFGGVQNQIDEIHEQLAHAAGPRTEVVGVLGSSDSRLRYTLPADLDGLYDVSVRVRARVFVHPLVNFSGNLRIIEDGGLGLDAAIPEKTHDYGNVHEGVLIFIRKGLSVSPGVNIIEFEGLVSGNNPPDVDFGAVENLVLTDASLVNANNVNPFIADWAETGDATAIPAGKLGNAPAGGLTLIADSTVQSMARTIGADSFIAGRTMSAGDYVLLQCALVNADGDVQSAPGWNTAYLIGTKVNFDWAVQDMPGIALHATSVDGEIQVGVVAGTNPTNNLYRIRVYRFAIV